MLQRQFTQRKQAAAIVVVVQRNGGPIDIPPSLKANPLRVRCLRLADVVERRISCHISTAVTRNLGRSRLDDVEHGVELVEGLDECAEKTRVAGDPDAAAVKRR